MRVSIRNRNRRPKRSLVDIEITSLLDIVVILMVFLSKYYEASGVVIQVPPEITLPDSKSQTPNNTGVIVQVAPQKIWIDNEVVVDPEKLPQTLYDHGGLRIVPLYNKLVEKRETYQRLAKSAKGANDFSGIVNLVVDKTVKYDYMKKLMYTCAEAGYKQYKFVVLGEQAM